MLTITSQLNNIKYTIILRYTNADIPLISSKIGIYKTKNSNI